MGWSSLRVFFLCKICLKFLNYLETCFGFPVRSKGQELCNTFPPLQFRYTDVSWKVSQLLLGQTDTLQASVTEVRMSVLVFTARMAPPPLILVPLTEHIIVCSLLAHYGYLAFKDLLDTSLDYSSILQTKCQFDLESTSWVACEQ